MATPRANGEQLIEQVDYLFSRKSSLASYFQDIVDYVTPHKADVRSVSGTPSMGSKGRRFDSTAVHSNQLLSNSIHGSLTNEASMWFSLTLGEHDLWTDKEIREWFDDCSKRLFLEFNGSGFNNEVQEAYESLTGAGTAAIRLDENNMHAKRKALFTFEAIATREYVFTEGEDGSAEGFYRQYELTAAQVMARWGSHPFFKGLPEEMAKALKSDKPAEKNKTFEIMTCIEPRQQYNPEGKTALDFPTMLAIVDRKTKKVIVETGLHEMSVMVPRWRKSIDDDGWGTGQGFVALDDILTLNHAKKMSFKAWAKDLDPPIVVDHKGVIGSIRSRAGGVIYKRRGATVDYLQSGARWDSSQFNFEELRNNVRQAFFVDQLQLHQSPQMTATEAQIRYDLMMRILGPTYGRMKRELYNPMLHRAFNIALRAGRFKPMPTKLQRALLQGGENRPQLDVEYLGPMARAQRLAEIEGIQRTFAVAAQIAETTGSLEVMDNLDADEAVKLGAEISGAPPKIIRDPKVVKKMRKDRQEAINKQRELEGAAAELDLEEKVVNIQDRAVG